MYRLNVPFAFGRLVISALACCRPVLFPIYGRMVPFHIDCIRSVSMPMEEPPFFYFHFYFDSPQKILGKNADIDSIAPPDSMYIQV